MNIVTRIINTIYYWFKIKRSFNHKPLVDHPNEPPEKLSDSEFMEKARSLNYNMSTARPIESTTDGIVEKLTNPYGTKRDLKTFKNTQRFNRQENLIRGLDFQDTFTAAMNNRLPEVE